jgi:hypothetical protein
MAGNIPNVSRNNFRYTNLLTGGLSTIYDGVPLQQGVPITDSDVNEMQDYQRMGRILDSIALTGVGFTRYGLSSGNLNGFGIKQATSTANNFAIEAGYASIGGFVVPSTTGYPAEFDYEDQILYSGAFTGVVGAGLQDTGKLFSAADSLAVSAVAPIHGACFVVIVNSANPTEIGHAANIASYTATELTINTVTPPTGYTIINPANLAANDTYKVMLPLLTTPAGDRTDAVYLQLWFDDINESEDTNIVNTSVPVECVHKTAKRWAVRVSEGSTTPAFSPADAFGFSIRYAKFGDLNRVAATAAILTAQITNTYECFTGLTSMNPKGIRFDDTDMVAAGYPNLPANQENVQDAIDSLIQTLLASTAGKGSTLVGSPGVAGTGTASLTAGTLLSQLAAIVGHLEDRIEAVNPNGTITAPIPIFRSHGLSLVSTSVTANTVTVYLLPDTDGGSLDSIGLCVGCYLATDQAYSGLSTGPLATMVTLSSSGVYVAHKGVSPGESWYYSDLNNWDYFEKFLGSSSEFSDVIEASGGIDLTGILSLENANSYILRSTASSSDPLRVLHNNLSVKPTVWFIGESVWITSNVTWDSGGNLWIPVSGTYHAAAVEISMTSINIHKTNLHKGGYASGWMLDSWDSKLSFAERATGLSSTSVRNYSVPTVYGEAYEKVHFAHRFAAPSASGFIFTLPINYRVRHHVEPANKVVAYTGTAIASVVYHPVDEWGGYLTVTSSIVGSGDTIEVRGTVEFYG